MRIHCGPGTYVRTVAQELGEALGYPAHLAAPRRLRSGPFDVGQAIGWPDVPEMSAAEVRGRLLLPTAMLPEWPAAVVGSRGLAAINHGCVVEPGWIIERRAASRKGGPAPAGDAGWVRVLKETGELVAAAELLPGGVLQPRVVLA